MKNKILKNYRYLCDSFYELLYINIYLFDSEGVLLHESNNKSLTNPFQISFETLKNNFLASSKKSDNFPKLLETSFLENYLFIKIFSNNEMEGVIVFGPVFLKNRSQDELTHILYDNNIYQNQKIYLEYLQNIKIFSLENLLQVSSIFYFSIYQKTISIETLKKNFTHLHYEKFIEKSYEEKRIHTKLTEQIAYDMQYEHRLLTAIAQGNPQDIVPNLESLFTIDHAILSKKSLLRSVKNKAIASVTLASRTAVSAGLDMETAFIMSNHYIQFIEDLEDVKSIKDAIITFFENYAVKIQELNQENVSKLTLQVQKYISDKIFENPRLSEIAKHVNLSSRHLSRTFKKEVGITIQEYILTQKIHEAKKMFQYTDYSISEISSILGFLDQSHFTKRFKQICHMTPLKYKKELK